MTDPRPIHTAEFDARHSQRRALVALLVLLALHSWFTWGYLGSFYSNSASWLYEVERYAGGQSPYRDFTWPFPPLGIWVAGGVARVLGSSLLVLSCITLVLTTAMYVAFHRLVSKVTPGVATGAAITTFVFAAAYAARYSPPLTLGGQSPGGPLGMLFVLVAVGLIIRFGERPTPANAGSAGAALALAALSRHDFWIPVTFLLAWGLVALRHAGTRLRLRWTLVGAFLVVFLGGVAIAVGLYGAGALEGVLPHQVREQWLEGFPTVERLVMEAAAASALGIAGVVALWLCFALESARATRMAVALLVVFLSACAVHLGMSVSTIRDLGAEGLPAVPSVLEESIARIADGSQHPLRTALYLLDQRFQAHLFPVLGPPILLGVLVLRWRRWPVRRDRDLALLLLGLAIALRARRGFSGTDWQNVLIELPAYALFLHLVAAAAGRSAQRAVSMALAILFVVGLYTYYNLGVGALTKRRYTATVTPRGTVRWDAVTAADYRSWAAAFDRVDPQARRPLLAYGPSGAWNYYFARSSPTRYTRGFTTPEQVDTVQSELRTSREPALIVDTRAIVRVTLRTRASVAAWDQRPDERPMTLLDLPRLGDLLQGCAPAGQFSGPPAIPLYDCAPAATPPDSSR